MSRWFPRAVLLLILVLAAALRLTGVDWDGYDHHHPDERYITWVATTIEWPADLSSALRPDSSPFNPFYWPPEARSKGIEVPQDEQRKFAYGHFPLYLGVAVTRLMERLGPRLSPGLPENWLLTSDILNGADLVEFRHLTAVTRALTALVDVGTVWLTFLLGRRLVGTKVGLLAAAFLALNVMHIQLARFFAFDTYMTFFVVAAIAFMVHSIPQSSDIGSEGQRPLSGGGFSTSSIDRPTRQALLLILAALCIGLAVGSKFAAIMLFAPLLVTIYLTRPSGRAWTLLKLAAVAAVTFVATNPFAILDLSCELITPAYQIGPLEVPALDWRSCFLDNLATQGAMVRGAIDLPFTRQYDGTLPYLYYIEMQLRWGMGPFLGIVAFVGFAWAAWQALRSVDLAAWRHGLRKVVDRIRPETLAILAWTVPYFLVTGSFYVKFMRYLQPLTPFLMLYGAALLYQWRHRIWRPVSIALILLVTGLYALSFVNLFQEQHPWTVASRWIYATVEPGALILSEQWDDALPVSVVVNGDHRRRSEYDSDQLTWLTRPGNRDDEEKLDANLALLAQADYLTLVSNRVYGVVPRLPDVFPVSSQYHQLLLDGSLGYEVVAIFGRFPNLFGYHLKPDTFGWPGLRPPQRVVDYLSSVPGANWGRADESFTVYDQPLTIIFENVGRQSAEDMRQLFELD